MFPKFLSFSRTSRGVGSERGTSAVELGLLIPWFVFSFLAVLDFGLASYGLISTENAARVAAVWGAASSANAQSANLQTKTCSYVLDELHYAPGVPSALSTCGAAPVTVTATYLASGADGRPCLKVAVVYTVTLLPIPGIMPGSLAISRTVQMPVKG